jgi:hypothetical protein
MFHLVTNARRQVVQNIGAVEGLLVKQVEVLRPGDLLGVGGGDEGGGKEWEELVAHC